MTMEQCSKECQRSERHWIKAQQDVADVQAKNDDVLDDELQAKLHTLEAQMWMMKESQGRSCKELC